MTTSAPDPRDTGHRSRSGSPARRRPLTVFLVLALGLGWAALTVPALTGLPGEPFLLFLTFVGLLGSALLVTRLADGPGGIRRLLGGPSPGASAQDAGPWSCWACRCSP